MFRNDTVISSPCSDTIFLCKTWEWFFHLKQNCVIIYFFYGINVHVCCCTCIDSVIVFDHVESEDYIICCYIFTIGPFDTLTYFYCPLSKVIIGFRHTVSDFTPLLTFYGIYLPQMCAHQLMNTKSHLGTGHVTVELTWCISRRRTLNDQCLGTRSSYLCSNTFRCCCSACICWSGTRIASAAATAG